VLLKKLYNKTLKLKNQSAVFFNEMGGFPKNFGVKIGHRYPLVFILALR
jgi:hypothetical protein